MRKNLFLATVSLITLSFAVPAMAADLAARPYTKAPAPMVTAIYDWSGFYIGLNGGGGSAHNCWNLIDNVAAGPIPALNEGCNSATGGTFGGQIGYRWQAANWVFGLEGQGNWADFSGSNNDLSFPGWTHDTRINSFGLITGQVGYAVNNVLLYVKGGAAVVDARYDRILRDTLVSRADETRWGGTVGVGFEFGFTPNLSVGVEYNHIFLGDRNVATNFVDGSGYHATSRINQDVDMGLVRLNYKFGGPVVAKY